MAGRTCVQALRSARGSATSRSVISREEQPQHPLRASGPCETPAPPCNSSRCGRAASHRSDVLRQHKAFFRLMAAEGRGVTACSCVHTQTADGAAWSRYCQRWGAASCCAAQQAVCSSSLVSGWAHTCPSPTSTCWQCRRCSSGVRCPKRLSPLTIPAVLTVCSLAISYPVSVPGTQQQECAARSQMCATRLLLLWPSQPDL